MSKNKKKVTSRIQTVSFDADSPEAEIIDYMRRNEPIGGIIGSYSFTLKDYGEFIDNIILRVNMKPDDEGRALFLDEMQRILKQLAEDRVRLEVIAGKMDTFYDKGKK